MEAIMSNNDKIASNCLVSQPILYPHLEIAQFNGFAWSNSMGMIHQSAVPNDFNPIDWLGTQE